MEILGSSRHWKSSGYLHHTVYVLSNLEGVGRHRPFQQLASYAARFRYEVVISGDTEKFRNVFVNICSFTEFQKLDIVYTPIIHIHLKLAWIICYNIIVSGYSGLS